DAVEIRVAVFRRVRDLLRAFACIGNAIAETVDRDPGRDTDDATILAILAPWIAPHDPFHNDLMMMLQPPSWAHPFDTDELGRDILSRVLYGGQLSILEGLFSVALAMSVGVPVGMISGYV